MNSIYFDSKLSDDIRRNQIYDGQLFIFSPCTSSLKLCELATELAGQAFGTLDPREAQHILPVDEYAAILAELKPKFTHHPKAKELLRGILDELGCDLAATYFDVPKLRTATSDGYLTTGIAYAWHPHRDTWYSAPQCQLNWWVPIHDIGQNDGFAFHPQYWNKALQNDSDRFNYYLWNRHRHTAANHIGADTRPLSRATEPVEVEPQVRPICPAGGIVLFSAAHLHSTVPNTSGKTRFSFDFRTVNLSDLIAGRGAPNADAKCSGTPLRDFLCGSDFSHIPNDVIASFDDGSASQVEGDLIFQPSDSAARQ